MPRDLLSYRRVSPRNQYCCRQHTIPPRLLPPPLATPHQCARLSPTFNSVGCTLLGDRVASREMRRDVSPRFANNSPNTCFPVQLPAAAAIVGYARRRRDLDLEYPLPLRYTARAPTTILPAWGFGCCCSLSPLSAPHDLSFLLLLPLSCGAHGHAALLNVPSSATHGEGARGYPSTASL